MHGNRKAPSLMLALLAATFLTPPGVALAAPGDALGPEFQVNSVTSNSQIQPAVAMDADGDFVVVWTDYGGQDGDSYGVFAQRYDAAGVAQGGEIQVNSFTSDRQQDAAVAMDADGDFVVVWESYGQDGSRNGVFAQLYDAAGVPQGAEFQVNGFITDDQADPAVAMDADGNFVVVWESDFQDGSFNSVFARRYDAAGAPQSSWFQVNDFATGSQDNPAVAMDADGNFVVVWDSYGQDGSFDGVFARRYNAAGAPQGAEFQVNSFTSNQQKDAAVAMDADGAFVVAWEDGSQDGDDYGIFAQRYDAAGVPQGTEFQVNSYTSSHQENPAVTMDADGDFVVAWRSDYQDGDNSGYGVFAQRYDAAGMPKGPEFQVNSFTTGSQQNPAMAMDADGDFVVAWVSEYQDGSGYGIFAQRYDGAERVEGDFDGDGNADVLWRNTSDGNTFVWLLEGTERRAAQSIGTVPLVWEVAGTGDFNGDGKADILWRHTGNGTTVVWQMDGFAKVDSASIGKPPLVWEVEQLRDTDGDGNSDIFWRNTTTGGTLVWRMNGFTKTVVGSPGAAARPPWEVQ